MFQGIAFAGYDIDYDNIGEPYEGDAGETIGPGISLDIKWPNGTRISVYDEKTGVTPGTQLLLYVRADRHGFNASRLDIKVYDHTGAEFWSQREILDPEDWDQGVFYPYHIDITIPGAEGRYEYSAKASTDNGLTSTTSIPVTTDGFYEWGEDPEPEAVPPPEIQPPPSDDGIDLFGISLALAGLIGLAKIGPPLVSRITKRSNPKQGSTYEPDPFRGATRKDGKIYQEGKKGLPEQIIKEDSDLYGPRVRMFSMKPPPDTEKVSKIVDLLFELPRSFKDDMHMKNWKNLSRERKGAMIITMNNIVKEVYGTKHKITISNDTDPKADSGGYTNSTDNEITINLARATTPRETLDTIVHECRHAYQQMIEDPNGTPFQQTLKYNNTTENFVHYNTDYVRYRQQIIENDAFNQAKQVFNEMKKRIRIQGLAKRAAKVATGGR